MHYPVMQGSGGSDCQHSGLALIRCEYSKGLSINCPGDSLLREAVGIAKVERAVRTIADRVEGKLREGDAESGLHPGLISVGVDFEVSAGTSPLSFRAIVAPVGGGYDDGWVAAVAVDRPTEPQGIEPQGIPATVLLDIDRMRASAMSETIDAVLHHVRQPSTAATNFLAAACEAVRRDQSPAEVLILIQRAMRSVQDLVAGISVLEKRLSAQTCAPCDADDSKVW